jgi:Bardet-Biedl syndrome 2 protein
MRALMLAAQEDGEMTDTQLVQKAEVAGLIANLKDLIVRIENSEMIGQYQTLYDSVVECERLNEEIGREHVKRIANKAVIGAGNQKVNAMIQKFAELRKGAARNALLQLARKELQSRSFQKLAYVLEHGRAIGAGHDS